MIKRHLISAVAAAGIASAGFAAFAQVPRFQILPTQSAWIVPLNLVLLHAQLGPLVVVDPIVVVVLQIRLQPCPDEDDATFVLRLRYLMARELSVFCVPSHALQDPLEKEVRTAKPVL